MRTAAARLCALALAIAAAAVSPGSQAQPAPVDFSFLRSPDLRWLDQEEKSRRHYRNS